MWSNTRRTFYGYSTFSLLWPIQTPMLWNAWVGKAFHKEPNWHKLPLSHTLYVYGHTESKTSKQLFQVMNVQTKTSPFLSVVVLRLTQWGGKSISQSISKTQISCVQCPTFMTPLKHKLKLTARWHYIAVPVGSLQFDSGSAFALRLLSVCNRIYNWKVSA